MNQAEEAKLLEQIEEWNDADEFSRCIEAIEATAGVRMASRRSIRSRRPLSGASSPGSCWDTASGRSPPI
jgi:hypothetical protein